MSLRIAPPGQPHEAAPVPIASRRWPAGPQGRQLFRRAADGNSPRQVKTSFALQFLHRIVGLEYLNFGLWRREDPLDVAGLRRAQERLVERLFELLPPDVVSVLDIGCGTGVTAERLAALGLDVEGLSPDPYHGRLFAQRLPDRRFHLGRFQEFEPDRRYDLLFLCESAQYVWLDEFFAAVGRALAPGGSVLLCDCFRDEAAGTARPMSGHPLGEFLARAEGAGLVLDVDEDITASVLPTLRLGQALVERFGRGVVDLLREASARRFPRLAVGAGRLARPFNRRLDRLDELLDPETFARTRRYRILRFRYRA